MILSRGVVTAQAASAPMPPGLPPRLGIGLEAALVGPGASDWMPSSGIPFDYAYQYLAGGVNTGSGWQTWDTGQGRFPIRYALTAHADGYVPVFTYFQLSQSAGPACDGCNADFQSLVNLNDPATMAAYFADFATLMKRLGPGTYDGIRGYGQTAIVHVEPDLSGYAEMAALVGTGCQGFCLGIGNDPSLLGAAVTRSDYPDVAGFPNTYQGFSRALLHLRDLYAPNVLLGLHVSSWGTSIDVGTAPGRVDADGLGRYVADFLNASGAAPDASVASTYDLVFTDVSDTDAAFLQYRRQWLTVFWDRLNVTWPNFQRWEQYVGAIAQGTGKPVLVWQIPLGNQVFRTLNNTDGHFQDNRAEYFFEHTEELRQAGVAALLFGPASPQATSYEDARHDGVTNPGPTCTPDGISQGMICADQVSSYADDDGGYLRLAATRYYQTFTSVPPRLGLAGGS